jgi:serine/threonine protein kinase
MADDSTQPSTQQVLDPRRLGRNNSGLKKADVSDVLCILHPGSPAAFRIVSRTAQINPQHVLQNWEEFDEDVEDSTFVIRSSPEDAQDLALRFSSKTKTPHIGFTFGRNPRICDIVLVDGLDNTKRISNMHFRIFVNENGVIMLEDQSTNGTLVDEYHIKGRSADQNKPSTRVISNGSTVAIPSPIPSQRILFHVRIPPRDGHEAQYRSKFDAYMGRMAALNNRGALQPHEHTATTAKTLVIQSNSYGMKWDGGEHYRVSGFLGKGAFANVYQLTTCYNGQYLAVKELEKRRFVKDGVLDRRLSNEMEIMKSVNHPNIVKYIDYKDVHEHLYIIMEYVPCGDLQQYLRKGLLSENNAKVVARQVLEALNYLHAKRITHRDIKPDNILMDCLDPISIKLSDFGLSKVKTEETFLKTFCGTLLYCAPEVFPHYQSDKQGVKRRHGRKTHTYDHAVDIWSLGGVLWYALSGMPPFEGVVDPTGRGMFDKITQNPPNTSPLVAKGVSLEAQDLLTKMLTIQPDRRPTAIECLVHHWLYEGKEPIQASAGLNSIAEETEEAQRFSQLSLAGGPTRPELYEDDFSEPDLDDFVFADATTASRSKRVKTDVRFPRNQIRAVSDQDSSEEISAPEPSAPERILKSPGRRKLFGEIGASALADSGVLGEHTERALAMHPGPPSGQIHDRVPDSQNGQYRNESQPAASLLGAESLVRELNMESPLSSDWHLSQDSSANSVPSGELPNRQVVSYSSEETPKAQHSRYESQADSTPTNRPKNRMPETMYQADAGRISDNSMAIHARNMTSQIAREFELNPPRHGTLISTEDSEMSVYLPLNNRMENWGRARNNTLVYSDINDDRIPKRAFCLVYHTIGIEAVEAAGGDWTSMPDLRVFIKSFSNHGIWVNGVHLTPNNARGEEILGYVHSGDIITIFQDKSSSGDESNRENNNFSEESLGSSSTLRFVCDFYHGEAKQPRISDFRIITNRKPPSKATAPPSSAGAAVAMQS